MRKDLSRKNDKSDFRHNKNTRPSQNNYYIDEDIPYDEDIPSDEDAIQNNVEEIKDNLSHPYKRSQHLNAKQMKNWWDNTPAESKIKLLLKNPIAKKVIIIAIIVLLILLVAIYLILVKTGYELDDYSFLATQCPTVTVINTDYDENTQNYSNKYDGQVEFEDYIAGVVAAKTGASSNNIEYYKMEAVNARTYFFNNFNFGCEVEGNSNYQPYIDIEDVEDSSVSAIIKQAVEDTKGETMVKDEQVASVYDNNLGEIDQEEALTLITEQNYTYEEALKYYYGEDTEIKNINISNSEIVNGFINPVNNSSCTSSYGCRIHPVRGGYDSHSGLDLGASSGATIYATKSGKIVDVLKSIPGASSKYSYGNYVLIDHGDGTRTRYAHMLYGSIPKNIVVGANVEQGEIIGQVGQTGTATGPHLHYEVYLNGVRQNPADYLDLSDIGNESRCNSNGDIPLSLCGL